MSSRESLLSAQDSALHADAAKWRGTEAHELQMLAEAARWGAPWAKPNVGGAGSTSAPGRWATVPVLRGVSEIAPLLDLCDKHGGRIVGGYVRYMCSPRKQPVPAKDVDVFPVASTFEESSRTYHELRRMLTCASLQVSFESPRATSYRRPLSGKFSRCPSIQLVKPSVSEEMRTWGPIEGILGRIDLTVAAIILNKDRTTALAAPTFLEDEEDLRLRVNRVGVPHGFSGRIRKYAARGYAIGPGEGSRVCRPGVEGSDASS